jgi:hypothetical protein
MLPQRPLALDTDFDPDFTVSFSHGEPGDVSQVAQSGTQPGEQPVEHHCQVCPTCGHRLTGHHCKLVCTQCGYYLSCADYY